MTCCRGMTLAKIVKRSIVIAGHKTSVSLEERFWSALKEIAHERRKTISDVVQSIDDASREASDTFLRQFDCSFWIITARAWC
jgi:predicted DNA-binding ribbon-helix-helix protein